MIKTRRIKNIVEERVTTSFSYLKTSETLIQDNNWKTILTQITIIWQWLCVHYMGASWSNGSWIYNYLCKHCLSVTIRRFWST